MQKKIIALAIVAAFSAPAFADTNVYGVVDAALIRAAADGQKSDVLAVSGGLSASRLGVKHTEALDGGLTAVVVLEYGLDTEIATGLSAATARQQMLAVAGDFGTVATGYLQTAGYDWGSKYDVVAGSSVSPLQNITTAGGALNPFLLGSKAGATRAQRAVAYISPSFGGFSFAVNYSTALAGLGNLTLADTATTADTKISATLVSATYDNGPLSVGGVYAATSNPVSANNVTEYGLGGSYDLGVATLKATYQSTKNANIGIAGSDNKAMSVGAAIPAGPGTLALSYAKSTIGTAVDSDGSGYTVAYLKGLSKVTTAYVAYSGMSQGTAANTYSVDNSALGGGAMKLGGGSSMLALGLNKKF